MRHTLSHEIAFAPFLVPPQQPSLTSGPRKPQDLPYRISKGRSVVRPSPSFSHSETFYRSPPPVSGRVSRSSARTRHTFAATRPVHTHPVTPKIPFSCLLFLPIKIRLRLIPKRSDIISRKSEGGGEEGVACG